MNLLAGRWIQAGPLLAKQWLSLTVALSAVVGWLLYLPQLSTGIFFVFFGTLLMSGGAAALNQYQERGLDVLMSRTSDRPIPAGLVGANQAFIFSVILIFTGVILFAMVGFYKTLVLGLVNIVVYNFIYTNLKTKTQFAVLPGAVVGAIPPMMGWTAAGGQIIDLKLFYFAMFIFLWQIPHFWLLMAKNARDYKKAGFDVISNQLEQVRVNRLVFFWAVISSLYILPMPVFFPKTPTLIVALIIILNFVFVFAFYQAIFGANNAASKNTKAFTIINLYAVAVMLLMVVNSFLSV